VKRSHLKTIALAAGLAVLMLMVVGVYRASDTPNDSKDHQISIMKIDGKWKVVDANDHKIRKIKVKRKDKVVWTAMGTDAYFHFIDDKLIGQNDAKVRKDKQFKATIADSVATGTYYYAVFCMADSEFATGDSPPVIIVE